MRGLVSASLTALMLVAQTPYDSSINPAAIPIQITPNKGAAALWQSLKKLHTRASLIMITAHPDDEDGAMLTYESRGQGVRASLLTLNRGEGGANVMSSDFWDALGLLRTQELLVADRYYGVQQYWTRVCDYGFSKTLGEALEKWTNERVLADVVRIVRATRPLVVTSVFVGGPSDGHGNHQVAGLMAKEVFEAAADPHRFPEQIREGLEPWRPLKYYAHTPWLQRGNSKLSTTVEIPVGAYDPLLGASYVQLSHEGLGMQKSQNGGSFIPRAGAQPSAYHRFASRVSSADTEQSFFDEIDVSLAGIADLAQSSEQPHLRQALEQINSSVEEAMSRFSATRPELCAPALANGLRETEALIAKIKASNLPEADRYNVLFELNIKRAQFNNALVEALSIDMRATVAPDQDVNPLFAQFMGGPDTFQLAIPGQSFSVRVSLANQSAEKPQLSRVYLDAPHDGWWNITSKGEPPVTLRTLETEDWYFNVQASKSIPVGRPYFHRHSIEAPWYEIDDPALLNQSVTPYPLRAWAELIYQGVSLRIGQVVQTSRRMTGLGVVYEPLAVAPAISVQLPAHAGVIPLTAESFNLEVNVHSNIKGPADASVRLQLPPGWRSEPPSAAIHTQNDGQDTSVEFKINPSNLAEKSYEILATVQHAGQEYREGYHVTGYPGLQSSFLYQPASYQATGVDLKLARGLKVAYVAGAGDDVPATLENLGIHVHFLNASDLAGADLSQYSAILLGIRAYAVRPDLIAHNARLLDYAKNGGVVIVQYNTPEFDHNYGPYPYKMGAEPEEVTDEQSKVQILEPSNPVFLWPNRITNKDFEGWIEERGSKFLTSWDPRYTALLETHDPGQPPQKGGLLYAPFGKGIYIYNAYAFYRELPEGVPGAYRLIANILSLGKNPRR